MSILALRRPLSADADAHLTGGSRAASWQGGTARMIGRWIARSRERRALRDIAERGDFHLLKDIGVSREEAFREADKPFWRR
jgi:uncharacterized protein YjiS (DUF1127 family)